MPQEAEHGKRFARDLRRIREARNLTVDDLHDETKIPLGLIEAFEKQALFDHPQFNRVYLRSFVRTYSQVVGIDADVALEGLEEALSGSYVGSLGVRYLGEEPIELPEVSEEGEGPSEDAGEEDVREEERGAPTTVGERPPTHDEDVREKAQPPFASTPTASAGFQDAEPDAGEEDAAAVDWTAQSPPSARMPPSGDPLRSAQRPSRREGPDRRWILGGALVVVIGALVWVLVSLTGDSEQTPPAPVVDTTRAAAADTPASAATAPPIDVPPLGETMEVRIVATEGKVDPLRVTVDDDLRRPYWIEHGDSMTFSPTRRIVIEELLDSVTVKLEGIEYPMSRRDERGRVVISRDTAEAYFSSLRRGR